MLNIKNNRECFFDDWLIDTTATTASFRVHQPTLRECVLCHDEPWEGDGSDYHNFFYDSDAGIYRMYYLGWRFHGNTPVVCYAESHDGLNWEKPKLKICEFDGSLDNNIILDNTMQKSIDNFMVFLDSNPACPSEFKYKAVSADNVKIDGRIVHALVSYYSSDAIHFTRGGVITIKGAFDSLNVAFWDKNSNKYLAYFRSFHKATGDDGSWDPMCDIRDIRYIESDDFIHWSEPQLIDFGSAPDIPLYTNNIQLYPRAPQIYIGLPTRYIERKVWTDSFDELCGRERRLERMKECRRYGLTVTDCVFICSRDGLHFKKYDEAFMRPLPENGRNWVYGDCYPARGILETTSNIDGAESELSLYAHHNHWMGVPAELWRYTLRRDGFVSLHAGQQEELILTKPFLYSGENLFTNFETSAWGYIYFTLVDSDGQEYCSCEYFGNSTDRHIIIPDNAAGQLSGRPVGLKIRLRDADIYSIQFK